MITLYTRSEAETIAFGECVGKVLKQGDVIALKGIWEPVRRIWSKARLSKWGLLHPLSAPPFLL